MNFIKKIISFGMLLLVAAPLIIFSAYSVKQKIVQIEMEEALEQRMLQTITLNNAAVIWEEEGKEIIIDGSLFDVKSYCIIKDKIILTGLYDMQETALKQQVEKLQQQKNNSENSNDNVVLKFMFTVAILPNQIESFFFTSTSCNNFLIFSESVVIQNSTILSPPPNV
jgi:hypothetical protein